MTGNPLAKFRFKSVDYDKIIATINKYEASIMGMDIHLMNSIILFVIYNYGVEHPLVANFVQRALKQ